MGAASTWSRAVVLGGAVSVALVGLGGCSRDTADAEFVRVDAPATPAEPMPDPELQGGNVGRAPRRITVDQLDASIQQVLGRKWNGLQFLGASLGKADFAYVTTESSEVNLVFTKFLDDGAREVCHAAARAELEQTDAASRILSPFIPDPKKPATADSAAVQKNLVAVSTRFWGYPLSGDELTRWTAFWDKVAALGQETRRPEQTLQALCIALMTDPRFLTY
ncbi:MAG: hypothetical protein WBV82_04665 [Myxococcaceae bacterium]